VVGSKGWLYDDFFRRLEELEMRDAVHFPGYIPAVDLPLVTSAATVVAMSSVYEGFGLPVLEAMACGTPVVAANNSSLPEVVGKAGLLVDASDNSALADALGQLLRDQELRNRLVSSGFEQGRRFTWQGAGKQLLDLYDRQRSLVETSMQSGARRGFA
jgi:glycosyltransferase involved in cell wall biosynthesis